MNVEYNIKQILTKEMVQGGFVLCRLPHDFYRQFDKCDVESRILSNKLKRKRLPKIIRFAVMGDLPDDVRERLATEELELFNVVREQIIKFEEVNENESN